MGERKGRLMMRFYMIGNSELMDHFKKLLLCDVDLESRTRGVVPPGWFIN